MGILERAYTATNREQDERLLIGGVANFQLRREIRELLFTLSPDDFYNLTYGRIWSVAQDLADESRIMTLSAFAGPLGESAYRVLESCSGMAVRKVEVERGIVYVREAAKRRRLLDGLKRVAETAIGSELFDDVLGAAHDAVDEADYAVMSGDVSSITELVDDFWDEVENPPEKPVTIPTPWPKLDELLPGHGLGKGGVMVSAAQTGRGKSLFMTNIAAHAALNGFRVAFFSMEMPRKEVLDRILACTAEVSVAAIANRQVSDDPTRWQAASESKLRNVSELLKSTTLHVWDNADMEADWIRAQCQAMQRTVGLDLVIVDYLQIMDSPHSSNREQTVSEDSRRLKKLAKALDVAVVTASQMNELEDGSVPTTKSLRESRGIGNNANQVVFVHHELDPVDGRPTGLADLVVSKNRGGRNGSVPVEFMGNQARFREAGRYTNG